MKIGLLKCDFVTPEFRDIDGGIRAAFAGAASKRQEAKGRLASAARENDGISYIYHDVSM